MTKRLLCLLLILALLPLTGACASAALTQYEVSFFDVFDTFSRITVYAESREQAQAWLNAAYQELLTCHRLYDIYNEYEGLTNLCLINRTAAQGPVEADGRITGLLAYAVQMHQLTGGRVNVAMGAVLSIWHDAREAGVLPDMQALEAADSHTDIASLVLTETTVAFSDPLLSLDVGAVAKGYATERAAQLMISQGVTSALLSIGGNVRVIGQKPDGSPYRTGVQNPDDPDGSQYVTVVEMRDLSLVTSGDYQRYFTVDGVRYHHIIDPDTLMPAAHMRSVSVLTEDSGYADALSTALFTLPYDEGLALVDSLPGVEAIWILNDGAIARSGGL